jgi:threonine aldolase
MFDRSLARRIDNRLKQAGQTASKTRFLAAPSSACWKAATEAGAAHANLMAQRLAAGIALGLRPGPSGRGQCGVRAHAARGAPAAERAGWACYRFDDGSVRFVCSWATTEEAVDEVCRSSQRFERRH